MGTGTRRYLNQGLSTLAKILASWKLTGWEEVYGRKPTPDDFIAPARTMRPASAGVAGRAFTADLARLQLRVDAGEERDLCGHDLRSWFQTRCIEDGAESLIVRSFTHAPDKSVNGGYERWSWAAKCRELAKLSVSVLDGQVVPLATALATRQTRDASYRGRWVKKMAETHGNRTHQAAARAELHRF